LIFFIGTDSDEMSLDEQFTSDCNYIDTVMNQEKIGAIFNISVISWQSVLLVEETGVKPPTFRKSLTNFIT
jgi:hypothetical protein